jgi:monofunctional glycosyltransferase
MAFPGLRRRGARRPKRGASRGIVRRWIWRALWLIVAAIALPHVILLAYRVVPPPLTPLMVGRLFEGEGLERRWVGLDDVAPALVAAVVAAEDSRFCRHRGVDWTEMRAAVNDYRSDTRVRGASTITMQTVKNLVLWPGRDVMRKGIEIYLAHYVELVWPKRRILEVYLNVAEWGPGVYGAEAAARRHFDRSAAELSRAEASLLAATLPSPRRWQPDRPTAYLSNRAASIRRESERLGPLLDCVH